MANYLSKILLGISEWFSRTVFMEVTKTTADAVYAQDLIEQLRPGSCILIRGTIRPQCKRFAVNLLYVRGNKSDIVFHFNPRLALRYIVRNSRINNSWGEEETTSVEKFHLDRNKTFELQIVASEREFLVALDGRHICAYVFRTPLERINKIEVEGVIDIEGINHSKVEAYPTISTEDVSITVPMKDSLSEGHQIANQHLVVPVTGDLPNGFKEGWQLEITGRIKILPSAFYINLQEGNKLWPHPMIPLHLNPRFYTSYGNHMFVRNSWMNGEWGFEERTSGFQFTPGKTFHIAIRRNPDSFGVWVDGILAGEFQFRTPVDSINTVYIHGDVQVQSIYLKDHIDDKYFSKSKENIHSSL